VFTYSVLQGLRGEAKNNNTVTVLRLFAYVQEKVKEITNNSQNPKFSAIDVEDFPLVQVK
jgi:hypothetical protein